MGDPQYVPRASKWRQNGYQNECRKHVCALWRSSWTGFSSNGCNIESVHACQCLQSIWQLAKSRFVLLECAVLVKIRFQMHVLKTPSRFNRKVFKMRSKWTPEGIPKTDKNRYQTVISVFGRALVRVLPQPPKSWILIARGGRMTPKRGPKVALVRCSGPMCHSCWIPFGSHPASHGRSGSKTSRVEGAL